MVVLTGKLKVLESMDPIVLIGADAMMAPLPARRPGWQFLHIGYGHKDCRSIMQFQSSHSLVHTVPLVSWPMPSNEVHKKTRKVMWAEPAHSTTERCPADSVEALCVIL